MAFVVLAGLLLMLARTSPALASDNGHGQGKAQDHTSASAVSHRQDSPTARHEQTHGGGDGSGGSGGSGGGGTGKSGATGAGHTSATASVTSSTNSSSNNEIGNSTGSTGTGSTQTTSVPQA